MRALIAIVAAAVLAAGCGGDRGAGGPYGAQGARLGAQQGLLGWDLTLSNLRWQADRVLVDVAARISDPNTAHVKAEDLRFGVYGTPAHPIETTGLDSCDPLLGLTSQPLYAPDPDRLTGTVCLGPLKERSAVRGVYVYSPAEKMKETTVAYGAAFPVGLAPSNPGDTGLQLTTQGVAGYRADGTPLTPAALGDPKAFTGNGFMVISLTVDAVAADYRTASAQRGGPLMLLAGPATPLTGLDPQCAATGSSVLILPEASLNSVHVPTSLCTHGEINAALLYASVSVIGTHAAVWTLQ